MTKKEFVDRCKELIESWKRSSDDGWGRYGDYEQGKDSAREYCANELKWLLEEYKEEQKEQDEKV